MIEWVPPAGPGRRAASLHALQRSLAGFAAAHGTFDVIDAPAIFITAILRRHGKVVARSIQPELHYLRRDLVHRWRQSPIWRQNLLHDISALWRTAAVLRGWRLADLVLCLGTAELRWMSERFPGWHSKLDSYVACPESSERERLLEVRRTRRRAGTTRRRFLWIARWSAHKGTARLVAAIQSSIGSDTSFTLAGTGPLPQGAVPECLLSSARVKVIPSFPRHQLPELLATHDVGLFTSDTEGWGLGLQEMLESGLPVFATNVGAVSDLQPFFPCSLHDYPPEWSSAPGTGELEDLDANGYLSTYNWTAIASRYVAVVSHHSAICRTA